MLCRLQSQTWIGSCPTSHPPSKLWACDFLPWAVRGRLTREGKETKVGHKGPKTVRQRCPEITENGTKPLHQQYPQDPTGTAGRSVCPWTDLGHVRPRFGPFWAVRLGRIWSLLGWSSGWESWGSGWGFAPCSPHQLHEGWAVPKLGGQLGASKYTRMADVERSMAGIVPSMAIELQSGLLITAFSLANLFPYIDHGGGGGGVA